MVATKKTGGVSFKEKEEKKGRKEEGRRKDDLTSPQPHLHSTLTLLYLPVLVFFADCRRQRRRLDDRYVLQILHAVCLFLISLLSDELSLPISISTKSRCGREGDFWLHDVLPLSPPGISELPISFLTTYLFLVVLH